MLTAWAEAMAWEGNRRAPDDQVLDTLLKEGGWLSRASFGWLPAAYLRTMPAYYRGVDPVIDHDHGNMPGLNGHSVNKPVLPPVDHMELSDKGVHEPAPLPRAPEIVKPHAIYRSLLPPGTCSATLASGAESSRWDKWCDDNCGATEAEWGVSTELPPGQADAAGAASGEELCPNHPRVRRSSPMCAELQKRLALKLGKIWC